MVIIKSLFQRWESIYIPIPLRDFLTNKNVYVFLDFELEELRIRQAADRYHDSLAVFRFVIIHLISF